MSAPEPIKLPPGTSVHCCEGGGYELRIVAPDGDELVWRLHDIVMLIQSGQFGNHLQQLDSNKTKSTALKDP